MFLRRGTRQDAFRRASLRIGPTLIATQCDARSSVRREPSTIVPVVKTLLSSRRTIVFPEGALPFALLSLLRISAPSAVSHWSTTISYESELRRWSGRTYLGRLCSPVRGTGREIRVSRPEASRGRRTHLGRPEVERRFGDSDHLSKPGEPRTGKREKAELTFILTRSVSLRSNSR